MRAQPIESKYLVRDELESVVLVDAENNAIGSYGKIDAHRDGKLHRAFSILITNPDGELLLQQRAACKYHFAQRWSNTCCGHPRPGEQTLAAARRRLGEEFGFSVPLEEVTDLQYRVRDPHSNLIEHEHLHVFMGRYDGEPLPNPEEISAYRWMLPIFLSLSGTAENVDSKLFLGWFGPRGLASIVFAIIVLNRGVLNAKFLAMVVVLTVFSSLVAHGISANPLSAVLGKRSGSNN
jgi:isopentenyl-diphosphate delta-isomerase